MATVVMMSLIGLLHSLRRFAVATERQQIPATWGRLALGLRPSCDPRWGSWLAAPQALDHMPARRWRPVLQIVAPRESRRAEVFHTAMRLPAPEEVPPRCAYGAEGWDKRAVLEMIRAVA
jgi:hypothetical protein